ncbi:hypothetical protein AJ78_00926 [Emergomyces pasteurianus Ep9510]|uniref:UBC core domain-containing protein n=1 Tax=Emergomyces pasteurianus Ep9510 TaxID=1447872 RepID=A0A1J9PS43_9EURO|nr:hypothetical protein AJ78_00926 [Emergomyces pasteurianus Ep9510]
MPPKASSLRRLASDHASLHNDGMPPNYLSPPTSAFSSFPDDLTQLTVLLTGPQGTPYSQGLWQLHLRMPEDYPKSPPKAAFKTRIWHPNVDESTGAVCVDTLKRDWEAKLTLRDVLITISCLLIHPNPDSALNSAAGSLLQDDYEAFARQAKLMTSIHAPIPKDMKVAVMEAKRRGDESGTVISEDEDRPAPLSSRKTTTASTRPTVVMKKPAAQKKPEGQRMEKLDIRLRDISGDGLLSASQSSSSSSSSSSLSPLSRDRQPSNVDEDDSDTEDTGSASKENDPSLSPSPVTITPSSSRKSVLGKRPLAVLASPSEPDMVLVRSGDTDADIDTHSPDDDNDGMTPSERNIAANTLERAHLPLLGRQQMQPQEQPRKSAKLSELGRCVNDSGRVRDDCSDQDSRCNRGSGSQVDRTSRQGSSVFGAQTPPTQPLLQSSNEKRTDGGKENEISSTPSIISASTTATTATATLVAASTFITAVADKSQQQQQRQKQKLQLPLSLPSGSPMETRDAQSSDAQTSHKQKVKAPQPLTTTTTTTSSMPTPKLSTSDNNNNLSARRISSATVKGKPRVGLRRL